MINCNTYFCLLFFKCPKHSNERYHGPAHPTTTVENDNKEVINLATTDKWQTSWSCTMMEKEAFIQPWIRFLKREG